MNRNALLICFFVVILCAIFSGTTYYGFNYTEELKENLESITEEYNGLNIETTLMVQRKQVFVDAFKELDKLKVGIGENVDFYSEAQLAIRRGGANVLSNSPNPPKGGRRTMKMIFTGDYYAIMRALAELRGLPNVVRVVTLNLTSTNRDIYVNSEIKADILLEALTY